MTSVISKATRSRRRVREDAVDLDPHLRARRVPVQAQHAAGLAARRARRRRAAREPHLGLRGAEFRVHVEEARAFCFRAFADGPHDIQVGERAPLVDGPTCEQPLLIRGPDVAREPVAVRARG